MKDFTGFMHGVNLGGWLSQCDYSQERMDHFIEEKDFESIAELGLDHVRLPFDYNVLETQDGAYIESGFERIAGAIGMARKNGLNIILDLHKTCGFSFDAGEGQTGFFEDEGLQERFYRLWEQMARRFGADPQHVAFELLNEVTDREYSEKWNDIAEKCIRRIRAYAKDTVILVGSYWNNHSSAVKDLRKPFDEKIVYNFHSYDPLDFTHQGATWIQDPAFDIARRVSFEESGVDEDYFENLFSEAIRYAAGMDTVLYCGEYGVIDRVNGENTLKWYQAISRVFDRHHIGRAAWTWRAMDFELCGDRLKPVMEELKKYL